jgi:2-oxoisovalerate dehydrogenase E1 component
MKFDPKHLSGEQLIDIYRALVTPRLIEEKMLILLRQNKISKWFSGIGQEAISVGSGLIMKPEEYVLPMHRNLGVFTSRGVPMHRLFSQFQGKADGFTNGRDRSFHFGTREYNIVGMISHLGPQLALADGIALAQKIKKTNRATLVFSGDGGSSEGDFHEALNVAAVWDLPVIFVIENNGYGLSTPSNQQFRFESFVQKGPAYGIEAISIDGNNILEVYHALSEAAEKVRKKPAPILIEANTFRMRGHEEASGTKYVPNELMEHWAKKDPIENYEKYLMMKQILHEDQKEAIRKEIKASINESVASAFGAPPIEVSTEKEFRDLHAPYELKPIAPASSNVKEIRFIDAISEGLSQSMEKYPDLILMGQDIADYGGVFKITEGFLAKFGEDRVRNTPLCESAIIGSGMGLSIAGMKSMVEMQFADFVTCGFNQIINNLAKSHYRWGQNADVVVRMPTGAGVAAGPFHSQSNESWFFHTPGLKIVYPSNPYDAKGLLNAAIEDPNPYMYFEHKALYRSLSGEVPEDYYTIEVGKAKVVTEGNNVTVVTYGMGVHWATSLAEDHPDWSIEVIDLRTLLPWDKETVATSVAKTNKVMVLHEDSITGGIGAEIAAWIGEHCFADLDAPVMREGSLDTPIPFVTQLEQNFLPKDRFDLKIKQLIDF